MANLNFLSTLTPCEYLPDRLSQLRYEVDTEIERHGYMNRLNAGWRRFGPILFKPECPDCEMCLSLRVKTVPKNGAR